MADDKKNIIIIKKRRRGDHDEHHGGAWKVAFADFAIAMMAFFMVLWIMEIASEDEREEIQYMLQQSSMFDSMDNLFDIRNSPFPIDFDGQASPFENPINSTLTGSNQLGTSLHEEVPQGERGNNAGRGDKLLSMMEGKYLDTAQLTAMAIALEEIAESLGAMENIHMEIVPQGLRIRIQDSTNKLMFDRGSVVMTPFFEDVLYALAPVLGRVQNRLIVSGHTDSTRYIAEGYSNWELSGDRALKARQVLVASGLPESHVLQVLAMADRMLIDTADPKSGKNRRIEFLILTKEADNQLIRLFGSDPRALETPINDGDAVKQAKQFARENQPVSRLEAMTQ
ncbi:OmpA family protein [Enterovibrio makurazakiensis]|uniref:OmpA family protein n=1 Tax=Enterovibrio gelatinilyticus TaxID=2899819 RepID=A0ABT5QZY4_9GAMM|nr:flagellar motor protein MotB [Enterovibrio sp. ZSDZ42]MDD1793576.1 OmpA family protein [Enterovibrio sp. ZSDZ42]